MNKKVKIIKNRSDIGAGTRGADMGIDALEIAAINQKNDFFNRNPYINIKTHNESIYQKTHTLCAKRINFVLKQCERVANAVKKTIDEGFFPLVLSGDHSSALGTLSGIKAAAPQKNIGTFWIDAHADLHSPYTTPSGNIHGMPLAAALNLDNKKNAINQPETTILKNWEKMKNLKINGAKIKPENIIYCALRNTEKVEKKIIEQLSITNYPVNQLRNNGIQKCIQQALKKLHKTDTIYISFDVDALDCNLISNGTGTPVPNGLQPNEIQEIIEIILQTNKTCCLEICEINPLLDKKGNKMAETAFYILNNAMTNAHHAF